MPTIVVKHTHHYEFEIIKRSEVQEGDVVAAASKDDEIARRLIKKSGAEQHTTVNLPESSIEQYREAKAENGTPVSRNEAIRAFVADAAMVHHAERAWWTSIEVRGEPETTQWLATVFELEGKTNE